MVHIRRFLSRAAQIIGSRPFFVSAVGLLAVSSVLGSGGLVIAQRRTEHDKTELKAQVQKAQAETAEVKAELAAADKETKCRAQLAANAEVYSGQINVGIAQLVVAAQRQERAQIPGIIDGLQAAIPKLTDALQARQDNVSSCVGAPR